MRIENKCVTHGKESKCLQCKAVFPRKIEFAIYVVQISAVLAVCL